jgi:hypothetical protein
MTTKIHPENKLHRWRELALFGLVAVLLICLNWTAIANINFEISDFAANSILIQDAKSFHLLTGNYSRVGFNHPGPAILQVLALGELIFHDLLHLVPSPFSGQLIAAALYNAFWAMLVYRLLYRNCQSNAAALLGLATFLLATSMEDFQILPGIWFPQLYVMPFAVFLLSSVRLAVGCADSLLALAISTGFLLNGHVSFVAITGIVIILSVLANFLFFRAADDERVLLSKAFIRTHAKRLAAAAAVVFAFLIPLLIRTIIAFPGPVWEYVAFSRAHQPNTLSEAFRYVSVYWGGPASMVGAGAVLMLIWFSRPRGDSSLRIFRSGVVIAAAATLATVFYAKQGVDLLGQTYLGLFYYAVPAMVAAMIVIRVFESLTTSAKRPIALILAAALGLSAYTYTLAKRPPGYLQDYNHPEIVTIYKMIKSLPGKDRVVLDVETAEAASIWPLLMGAEAYGARRGDFPFCVNHNWFIAYTKRARCSPAELASGVRLLVQTTGATAPASFQQVATAGKLTFYRPIATNIVDAGNISADANPALLGSIILKSGWAAPEGNFVWSDGRKAYLSLPLRSGFSGTVKLDLAAFLPKKDSKQEISVRVNEGTPLEVSFDSTSERKVISVPVNQLSTDTALIEISIAHPTSPLAELMSTDSRLLGVRLFSLNVRSTRP